MAPSDQPQVVDKKRFGPHNGVKITSRTAVDMAHKRWEREKESVAPIVAQEDSWRIAQRDSARARIKRLEKLMDAETEPKNLQMLAKSWSALCEEERKWDGRPLPGSRRPSTDKPSRASYPEPT